MISTFLFSSIVILQTLLPLFFVGGCAYLLGYIVAINRRDREHFALLDQIETLTLKPGSELDRFSRRYKKQFVEMLTCYCDTAGKTCASCVAKRMFREGAL